MITTTFTNVKVLLSSPSLGANYSERMLLKSLGTWLGRLTLAKGQPIRHKDLDLKGIVLDAYESGKMLAILPFICKVILSFSFFLSHRVLLNYWFLQGKLTRITKVIQTKSLLLQCS